VTIDDIQQEVIQFLSTVTGLSSIDAETDLESSGIIDSLTMMDLLVFVETKFGVRLDFDDLTPESFHSPATLSRLISMRIGQSHDRRSPL
jgi:acyl carrier protein